MNLDIYAEIWQSFITGDHISQGPIWGGEGLALIIPIEVPGASGKIEQTQSRLAERLPFAPHSPENLHISVYLLGSSTEACTSSLTAYLQSVLATVPAFWAKLNHINSFFRGPFLEIHDSNALNHLLDSIQPGLKAMGYPGAAYGPRGQVWHVTLGGYTRSNDGADARGWLKELRELSAGLLPVGEVRLVKASTGLPYRMETLEHFLLNK